MPEATADHLEQLRALREQMAKAHPTPEAVPGLAEDAAAVRALEAERDTLDTALKDVKRRLDEVLDRMGQRMLTANLQNIKMAEGDTFYVESRFHVSFPAEHKPEVIGWLDRSGRGELAQRNFHPGTVEAMLKREFGVKSGKRMIDLELPAELESLTKVWKQDKVRHRRASK